MAETDWTAMTAATHGALESGDVSKGVTSALGTPNGGLSYALGFHSLTTTVGAAGYLCAVSNFAPLVDDSSNQKGGSIRAALRRYSSSTKYAPFIGILKGTNINSDSGYFLGLSNSSPYQIVLYKGKITASGLPTSTATTGVLRVSSSSWTDNTKWFHLRLDVIVNPNGDVVLNVYENDLSVNSVTSPTWTAPAGMSSFTDDALGVLSKSTPYKTGLYPVIGHYAGGDSGAVSLIDHVEVFRQKVP